MEDFEMTDKQYDGMIKESIFALDRVAKTTKEPAVLKAIYSERKAFILKLCYDIDENGLYDSIK